MGAGWLGVLSPADVKLLREAYNSEGNRLQQVGVRARAVLLRAEGV